MSEAEQCGTAIPDVERLRDVVRPMANRWVWKRAALYPDVFSPADVDELTGTVLEKYTVGWNRGAGNVDRDVDDAGVLIDEQDRDAKLGGWIKKVSYGVVVDELRRRGARPERVVDLAPPESADVLLRRALGEMATPSLITHHKLLLHAGLDELAKDHPEDPPLILARYEEGKSIAEIAADLGISAETAKQRIRRATRRLRKIIERLLSDDDPSGSDR